MIEFCIFRIKLRIDFTFIAVILLFLLLDTSGYGILGLYACIIHELGHLLMMLVVRCRPDIVTFYGAGMKITSFEQYKLSLSSEVAVILSGSTTNFLSSIILFKAFPLYLDVLVFAMTNLVIGVFNLLPIFGFDGERLLSIWLNRILGFERSRLIVRLLSFIASAAMLCVAAVLFGGGTVNFTIIVTLLYFTIISAIFCKH